MIDHEISHYRIVEKLGEGGMGVVYKALDTLLGRSVALKALPAEMSASPERRRRFLREARAASALNHPGIVTIYDVVRTDDHDYIVMELVEGVSLRQLIRPGGLPLAEALAYATGVADAVGAAHRAGVIHRDIKPGNVMVLDDGRVKVLDFGLAKREPSPESPTLSVGEPSVASIEPLTAQGLLLGTPHYMSPEQAMGEPLDGRSDVFSLGSVLYELLTGNKPFHGPNTASTLFQLVDLEPPPVESLRAEFPAAVGWLMKRALAKRPEDRFQTMDELAAALRELLAGAATETVAPGSRPAAPAVAVAVAILPFADLSPGQDQAWFCEGLAEEMVSLLARVEGLRVVSRTSTRRFRSGEEDIREVGRRLAAGHVLEGSVRKAGERVRISVSLVDVRDGYHLWSERYDRGLEDIFEVQEEVASSVVEVLRSRLAGPLGGRRVHQRPRSLSVYGLYLNGRHHWSKRTESALLKSVDYFQQAIDEEPGYARSYAGLADAWVTLGIYGALAPEAAMPRAEAAARQALEIDGELAEAHAALGTVEALYTWSWPSAESCFRRALELDPSYATAHQWLAANCLVPQKRFGEAGAALRQALELDPISPAILASFGIRAFYERSYEEAEERLSRALELNESFAVAHLFLGQTRLALGRPEAALAALGEAVRLSGESVETAAGLAYAQAVLGRRDEALAAIAALESSSSSRYVSPSLVAQVWSGLGENERALELLRRACELRTVDLAWLDVRPAFDGLRDERDFRSLVAAMGLAGTLDGESLPASG